ncbi:MAG: N-acetylglucosamine kinase [Clostridium sp.]
MKYVIGVDGGGTKTEAVAYDLDGNILSTKLTGFGNLVNGKIEALKNITTAIQQIFDEIGQDGVQGIYLGLAGSEVGDNSETVSKEIKEKFNIEAVMMNDASLALKALLRGEDGILVIAGTGSIAFGISNNEMLRCGGWGHLLGDEGSAYKISIEAFKRMINESDFALERSELSQAILDKLNMKEVDEILGFIYSSTKDEIAQMAGLVSKYAEQGDEYAINILQTEGIAIAKACEGVFNRLGFTKCRVGLVGSVIRKSHILREAFENYLKERINVVEFVDDEVSPAKGAYYIYKKENM